MMLGYLIILVLFTCCTSQPQFGFYPNPLHYRPRIDNDKNCVCYSNVGPTVAELLQSDQKRLTVYLYKDQNNNLRIYTPSYDNQLLLPDLRIRPNDKVFDVNPESTEIQQIFNSGYAVDLKANIVINNDTSDFETSELSSVISGERGYKVIKDDSFEESANDYSQTDVVSAINSQYGSSLPVVDPLVNHSNEDEVLSNLDDDISSEYVTAISTNQADFDNESSFDEESVEDVTTSLPVIDVYESSEAQGNSLSTFHGSQMPYAFNSNGVPVYPGLGTTEPIPNNPKNSDSSGIQELELGSQSTSVSNLWADGSSSSASQGQLLNELYSTDHEFVTFDAWFDHQMQRIQNTGQAPNKNFDLSSVKQLLEKTLYENAMFVTKDGVLINSKGDAINVSNLKLRPILIGDSVAYDSVFSVNDANNYELPSNLQYLEAILVTSVNPPKILGVIPIGKTYIPRVSYRRKFDYWDWKAIDPNKVKQAVTIKDIKPDLVKPTLPKASRILLKTSSSRRTKPLTVKLISASNEPAMPRVNRKYGRRGAIKSFLKTKITDRALKDALKSLLFDKVQESKNKVASLEYKGNNGVEDVFEEQPAEEYDEQEEPWFRIIGGNAATSSGTPVSSKGRSGYPYPYYG